ncbi:MAG TPA: DUF932 domain-containing protein [Xanthobacteraceae bacterium]|nr:DUF932 domain-containing protein [Xanthobacteraceae bacterium]
MALMLHAGANPVSYDELRQVIPPPATETHVPIPHHEIIELLRYTVGFYGHEITEEHHGVTPDGNRYFGVLTLRSPYGDYQDMLGLRNSHDRTLPIGIAFGSRVFVCDNLAFSADHVIRRKHTVKAKRELPGLITEIVRPLQDHRIAQNQKLLTYQKTPISDAQADHVACNLYRQDIIGVQKIGDVLWQWEHPSHDWGDKSAWRLFNSATYALRGKLAEKPDLSKRLHEVIDGVCQ